MSSETIEIDLSGFPKKIPKSKPKPPLKSVDMYTLEGVFVRSFKDYHEAHNETKVSSNYIKDCCEGRKLYIASASCIFLYDKDNIEERMKVVEERTPIRVVNQYSLEGVLLNTYVGYDMAALANGISKECVRQCIIGRALTSRGKIYLLKGDSIENRLRKIQKRNRENRKWQPIKEYSLEGAFIRDWPNQVSARKYYGTHSDISLCCSGKTLTAAGRIFLFPEDSIEERLERLKRRRHQPSITQKRRIIEYDLQGNQIRKWNSMSEAERFYHIARGKVCRCCKGDRLIVKGRIFLYEKCSINKRLKQIKAK